MAQLHENFPGAEVYDEAVKHNYPTFQQRALEEHDQRFAEDLLLSSRVAASVRETGGMALAVGGYARDTVLARLRGEDIDSKDIDVEVYGVEFDSLVRILSEHGRVDLVGASFGIAKVKNPLSGSELDFSIPRKDSKIDKGHKGFKITGDPDMTIEEAARRRDLSINALALDPLTGELFDYYDGLADLEKGLLRATDPLLFRDDPLRVMRVIQFAGRFGFGVEPATLEICSSMDLTELPMERIGDEWIKLMMKSSRPSIGLQLAFDIGLFDQIHPELSRLYSKKEDPSGKIWQHTKNATDSAVRIALDEDLSEENRLILIFSSMCLDLARLSGPEAASEFLRSLKLSKTQVGYMVSLLQSSIEVDSTSDAINDVNIKMLAASLRPANIYMWDLLSRADSNGYTGILNGPSVSSKIYERADELGVAEAPLKPIVQGRHLIEHLGLKPGPNFKSILKALYDAQLRDDFSSVEEAIDYYRAKGNL